MGILQEKSEAGRFVPVFLRATPLLRHQSPEGDGAHMRCTLTYLHSEPLPAQVIQSYCNGGDAHAAGATAPRSVFL